MTDLNTTVPALETEKQNGQASPEAIIEVVDSDEGSLTMEDIEGNPELMAKLRELNALQRQLDALKQLEGGVGRAAIVAQPEDDEDEEEEDEGDALAELTRMKMLLHALEKKMADQEGGNDTNDVEDLAAEAQAKIAELNERQAEQEALEERLAAMNQYLKLLEAKEAELGFRLENNGHPSPTEPQGDAALAELAKMKGLLSSIETTLNSDELVVQDVDDNDEVTVELMQARLKQLQSNEEQQRCLKERLDAMNEYLRLLEAKGAEMGLEIEPEEKPEEVTPPVPPHLQSLADNVQLKMALLQQQENERRRCEEQLNVLLDRQRELMSCHWKVYQGRLMDEQCKNKILVVIDNLYSTEDMREVNIEVLGSELKLPDGTEAADTAVGIYALGVNDEIWAESVERNWFTNVSKSESVDAFVVADLMEFIILHRNSLTLHFIGCDYQPYLALFEKAAKYEVQSTVFTHDQDLDNPVHKKIRELGISLKEIQDIIN